MPAYDRPNAARRITGFFLLFALCASFSLAGEKEKGRADDTQKSDALAAKEIKEAEKIAEKAAITFDKKDNKALWSKALSKYGSAIELASDKDRKNAAKYGAAEASYYLGKLWEAYLFVESSFPRRFEPSEVRKRLELETLIAKALMSVGEKEVESALEGKKKLSGYAAASRVFKAIVYNDPRSSDAPQALLLQGDCHLKAGEYESAEKAYRDLGEFMGKTPQAIFGKAALAETLAKKPCKGGMSQDVSLEIEQLIADVEVYRDENEELGKRIDAALAAKQEAVAGDLFKKGKYHLSRRSKRDRKAAVFLFEDIIKRFPKSPSAVEARKELEKLGVKTGDNKE